MRWIALGLATLGLAACTPERARPVFDPIDPQNLPTVAILSPLTNTTVITPGDLRIRIQVANTFGLLDAVSATAVRFTDDSVVARSSLTFSPSAGDTTLTLRLYLDTLPHNTQLNLTATATVSSHVATSGEVGVMTLDCSEPQFYCP